MQNLVLLSAALGMALFQANHASASIMFESGAGPFGPGTTYIEDGYKFSSTGTADISTIGGFYASKVLDFQDQTITLTSTNGIGLFDLVEFDIAADLSGTYSIVGSGIGQSLLVVNPGTSLTTHTVNWLGLSSVVFSFDNSSALAILDNLNVTSSIAAVPEPATTSILGLGTMIGAFCQYRRRKRAV